MKSWKKMTAFGLCLMTLVSLSGCSTTDHVEEEMIVEEEVSAAENDSMEGVHAFVFKSMGNAFGDRMYEGFAEYMAGKGEMTAYTSPAEATVEAQVQILDELIEQKVASITISANGDTGYDEVFEKAKEAGIPIVSVDSEANSEYRNCHINQAATADIGAYLVQAAVLITLGIDFPGEGSAMADAVEEALAAYTGEEIVFGVLSASADTPVQNGWIAAMEDELAKGCYTGKVSPELDKKYGNDDSTESAAQAAAFLTEKKVDCIISPTTVGIAAAGQVLKNSASEIKLTGLGLPSEMQAFMPTAAEDDAFAYVCPYMMLWDVIHLGATAGAAAYAAVTEDFDGQAGSTFEMDAFRNYETTIYEAYTSSEGTEVLAGTPYIFHKGNMAEWVDIL